MARTRRNEKVALLAMMLGATAVGSIVGVLGGARSAYADPIANQEVTYTLYFQGKPAGTHTLEVRHFAPRRANGEETRIVESYEDIRGADVPEALWRRTRASARASGNSMSFTAVTETGQPGSGRVTEVNGQRRHDGTWTLNINRGLASETAELRRSQADLCTLDLLDPLLHARLVDRPIVRMVDVTTGKVVEGRTADLGEMTAALSTGEVGVRRASFETDGHTWQWDWNLEGLLVQYNTRLGSAPLTARADTVPGMRTWGAIEATTRFDNGVPIVQDDL
jgi:YD repeat-containing protein